VSGRQVRQYTVATLCVLGYVIVVLAAWMVAFAVTDKSADQKVRVALIGVASGITAGLLSMLASWFTAWRTSELARQREERAALVSAAEGLQSSAEYYDWCRRQSHRWSTQAARTDDEKSAAIYAGYSLEAHRHAEEQLKGVMDALAKLKPRATRKMQEPLARLEEALAGCEDWVPADEVKPLPWGEVCQAAPAAND